MEKYFILGVKVLRDTVFCYNPQKVINIEEFENGWKNKPKKDSLGLEIIRAVVKAENSKIARRIFRNSMSAKGYKVSYIYLQKLWFCRQHVDNDGSWVTENVTPVKSHEELMNFIACYPGFDNFIFACRAIESENERFLLVNAKNREIAQTNADNSLRAKILRDAAENEETKEN